MLNIFTPTSEPLLKAVSSANSEALVVNGKNNSLKNNTAPDDFKSALNQAQQQAPQQAETRGEQVNRVDANEDEANRESVVENETNTPSPEKIALSSTEEQSSALETTAPSTGQENTAVLNAEAAMAFAYVTPVPPMTLERNAPVEEFSNSPTPEPSFPTAGPTPLNPLELTPIDEVNPAVVEEALAAMKLQANQKSVSVDGNVLQNVPETSPLKTETGISVERESETLQDDSTQEDGLLNDENTPTEETVVLNAPLIDPSMVPADAFTAKSIEGVLDQNIVEQGIQPLGLQVVRGIQSAYDSASKTMQLQLNPEDLGHMRIQIKQVGEGLVSARLVVERPEAVEQVKTQLQDLQRSLEQQGLKMDKIDIVLAGANNQASGETNKESKNDWKEQEAFQDNPSGGFQQSAQEEQRQAFQENFNATSPQGAFPVEDQGVQARLEELNSLRQSYQTYKQQSLRENSRVFLPEQAQNQNFSPVQQAGINVLA
jgi:hypothetical protein